MEVVVVEEEEEEEEESRCLFVLGREPQLTTGGGGTFPPKSPRVETHQRHVDAAGFPGWVGWRHSPARTRTCTGARATSTKGCMHFESRRVVKNTRAIHHNTRAYSSPSLELCPLPSPPAYPPPPSQLVGWGGGGIGVLDAAVWPQLICCFLLESVCMGVCVGEGGGIDRSLIIGSRGRRGRGRAVKRSDPGSAE